MPSNTVMVEKVAKRANKIIVRYEDEMPLECAKLALAVGKLQFALNWCGSVEMAEAYQGVSKAVLAIIKHKEALSGV